MNVDDQSIWIFKEYVTDNGTAIVTKWYKKLKRSGQIDKAAESRLITALDTLSATTNALLWDVPYYKKMTDLEGIGEIRFKNKQGLQLRIFGTFAKDEKVFALLIGAIEDQAAYEPTDARSTAADRRKDVFEFGQKLTKFEYNSARLEDDKGNEDETGEEES